MAPKSSSSSSSSKQASSCCSCGSLTGWLKFFAVLLGVLAPVAYFLERNLESFYIFDLDHLADVSRRSVERHGNDTRAMVKYIVDELNGQAHLSSYISLDEQWVFNNAGGAMGAMYIIHASTSLSLSFSLSPSRAHCSRTLFTNNFFLFFLKKKASPSTSSSSARRSAPRATRGGTRPTTTFTS